MFNVLSHQWMVFSGTRWTLKRGGDERKQISPVLTGTHCSVDVYGGKSLFLQDCTVWIFHIYSVLQTVHLGVFPLDSVYLIFVTFTLRRLPEQAVACMIHSAQLTWCFCSFWFFWGELKKLCSYSADRWWKLALDLHIDSTRLNYENTQGFLRCWNFSPVLGSSSFSGSARSNEQISSDRDTRIWRNKSIIEPFFFSRPD